MVRTTGLGYTRRDKIFAEFDFDTAQYVFKESHTSKNGVYKVGIYKDGEKVFKVDMTREQINRIKENKGIANVKFIDEAGFESFIENNYLNREFNEQGFIKYFVGYEDANGEWQEGTFINRFRYLENEPGFDGEVSYTSYLISLLPPSQIENLYRNNKRDFEKIYRYEVALTLNESEKAKQENMERISSIKAQALQYLNVHNIDYDSKEEFIGYDSG